MVKKSILTISYILSCTLLFAQARDPKPTGSIAVHRDPTYIDMSPEDLIKNVFISPGTCTDIKNVTVRLLGWDNNKNQWDNSVNLGGRRALAYFDKADSDFPLPNGLILSTADVRRIEGPNNVELGLGNREQDIANLMGDNDLQSLVGSQRKIYNVSVIEFDFTAVSTSASFNYIFASEEYPQFVNTQFNDVFGFFVHKKGDPDSKTNIAILPETESGSYIISTDNVNDGRWTNYKWQTPQSPEKATNPRFFVRQPEGTLATQFNGYTYDTENNKPLQAVITNLEICQEYHIKLAIGNLQDNTVGSGVFLEAHSFKMEPQLEIISDNVSGVDTIFRKCDSKIRVNLFTKSSTNWDINLSYSGLVNGVDIMQPDSSSLPLKVSIPAGQTYIDIPFVLSENVAHNSDFKINLVMNCPCNNTGLIENEISINIQNNYPVFKVNKVSPCDPTGKGSITVETVQGNSNEYQYSKDGGLTWQDQNVFDNLAIGKYDIKIRHANNCDELPGYNEIEIAPLTANAGQDITQCDPVFTMNANTPSIDETGMWTIVSPSDGISIANPTLYNTSVTMNLSKTNTATLKWTVTNNSCTQSDDVVINYQSCGPEGLPVNPHLRSKFK